MISHSWVRIFYNDAMPWCHDANDFDDGDGDGNNNYDDIEDNDYDDGDIEDHD